MAKKVLIILGTLLLAVGSAFAGTGPSKVYNTPHNLSYLSYPTDFDANYAAPTAAEDQICIYCHTPHGGTLDAPLWNRDISSLKGKAYNTYVGAEMAKLGIASSRTINAESLVCLSCHDGSLGVGDIINSYNNVSTPGNATAIQLGIPAPGPLIGFALGAPDGTTNDLSDDHPISFSYSAVLGQDTSKLQAVSYVEGKSLTLFGAAKNVECSTCHDPHVDYINNTAWDPFLAIPNAGSDLCLSCHIK